MHRIGGFLIFLVGVLAIAAPPTNEPAPDFARLEREWAQAIAARDVTTLDKLLSDEWITVNPKGKVQTKAEVLASLRGAKASTEPGPVLSDIKVIRHGDAAQVWGRVKEKSSVPGQERAGEYVFGDLFVKRNGSWQAVYSHTTKVERGK